MARRGQRSAKRRGRVAGAHYEMTLASRALSRTLLIVALALLACHLAVSLYNYRVEKVHWALFQLVDVDQENNLPTWYSTFLLLTTSAFLWVHAQQTRAERAPWFRHWYALAVGFLLLSAEEVAGVHESINSVIVMTWAIPGGIIALAIGLAFIPFLLHLPRRTAVSFALAGAAYLTGAAGLEIVGNSLVGQRLSDTLAYKMTTLAEESLEMLAVIFFLHSLLRYMRGPQAKALHASLEVN